MNLTTITTSRSINIKEQSLFVAWVGVGVKAEDYIIFLGGEGEDREDFREELRRNQSTPAEYKGEV